MRAVEAMDCHFASQQLRWIKGWLRAIQLQMARIEEIENTLLRQNLQHFGQAQTFLYQYAHKFHYCFQQWKTVVTCMIEKEVGNPMLHSLGVIHLYKVTLNALLGMKFCHTIHHAEDLQFLNEGMYGSCPNCQALDAIFLEILQLEYTLATRQPHMKIFNDATLCYDHMLSPAILALFRPDSLICLATTHRKPT